MTSLRRTSAWEVISAVIFPYHLQRVEMFAVQRSDENETQRSKFSPDNDANSA